MKPRSKFKYIVYLICIIILLIIEQRLLKIVEYKFMNLFLYNSISVIFNGCIGFMLGIDTLLSEAKKQGYWKVDIYKLLILGLPAIYFSYTSSISGILRSVAGGILVYPIEILVRDGGIFVYVFQVILGYTISTAFYK